MNWLAHTTARVLDPQEIDLEDTRYFVPCFASPDLLASSIARLGIINLPVLQETSDSLPIPVLGRRRVVAALKLEIPRVEVRIIPSGMSIQDGFELALWDNLSFRAFDVACTAVVVKRLLELFPRNTVVNDFLPKLNVPQHGPRLERLAAVGCLELPVLAALASGRIHEKTAWMLSKLDPHERDALLTLCGHMGLNANKTAEVVESLFDLSVIQQRSVLQILEQQEVRTVMSDPETDMRQRAEKFRHLIRSWKFPDLVAQEKRFQDTLAAVSLPRHVTVRPTAGFESPECTLEVRCRSAEEAVRIARSLPG